MSYLQRLRSLLYVGRTSKDRFRFAQMHKDWTVSDWEQEVFSDETKICHFNSNGKTWCWIEDEENIHVRAMNQTVKHGGGSIML